MLKEFCAEKLANVPEQMLTENCLLFLAVVEDDDGEWDDDWDDQSVDVYRGDEEGAGASGQGSHGPSVMISLNK